MQTTPGGAHIPQLALQQSCPAGQVTLPQVGGWSGTQAQTCGDESKWDPRTQRTVSIQVQMPPQSAPPFAGSQSSLGSSTHFPPPGQGVPRKPPQVWVGGGWSGTQAQTCGDESKWDPSTQRTFSTQTQMPPQSAPPFAGSQLSLGSSTHVPPPGQGMPAMPPQVCLGAH
jgi:hypothetical protein